jgi:parallel beta-helix repeat protein
MKIRHIIATVGAAATVTAGVGLMLTGTAAAATGHTIIVSTTIQAAVDAAAPGDTIVVPPGIYQESVVVSRPDLTITGGPKAVLEGEGLSSTTGIRVKSTDGSRLNGFTLTGMVIRDFSGSGILLDRVDNFRLSRTSYVDNDDYGLFPIRSSGRVDHNTVSGSNDTGLYVGQSSNVVLASNVAYDNTIGIDVELSTSIQVRDNLVTGNTVGVAVQIVPGLPLTSTSDVVVAGNVLTANNRPNNVTDPTELLSMAPSGIGLLVVAADRVTVEANVISNNPSAGIGVVSLPPALAVLDPRLQPSPDGVRVTTNLFWHNGLSPDPKISPLQAADIVWDGTGTDDCFTHEPGVTTFPTPLPSC